MVIFTRKNKGIFIKMRLNNDEELEVCLRIIFRATFCYSKQKNIENTI